LKVILQASLTNSLQLTQNNGSISLLWKLLWTLKV